MDARQLKDKAQESFTKGRWAKAAELYGSFLQKEPSDHQARLRMGDAFAKAGQRGQAIASYARAAEGFAKDGFLPRAIAASKLILELDPSHQGVQQMLAELYARRATSSDRGRSALSTPPAPSLPGRSRAPIEMSPEPPPAPAPEAPVAKETRAIELGPLELVPGTASWNDELPAELQLAPPHEIAIEVETSSGEVIEGIELDQSPEEVLEVDVPVPEGDEPLQFDEPIGSPPSQLSAEAETLAQAETAAQTEKLEGPPAQSTQVDDEDWGAAISGTTTPLEKAADPSPRAPPAAPPGLQKRKPSEVRPSGRIFVPPAQSAAASPAPTLPTPTTPPSDALGRTSDLRASLAAFSRFEELELDLHEVTSRLAGTATTSSTPALQTPKPEAGAADESHSLLQAVEVAAVAGINQRALDAGDEGLLELPDGDDAPELDPGALPKIPLFSDLPPDAFIALFERCPIRRFTQGQRVIGQGSVGDAFYVICEGLVRVVREDAGNGRVLATLEEGSFFGEMALLSGAPRTASVESAAEDTQLLEISAPMLTQLSREYPVVAQALKKFCRQRMLSNLMQSSALFRPFNKGDRKQLVERFRAREVPKDSTIIREGDRADGLYVVLSGELTVEKQGQVLARLREGDLFGEMSLLQKSAASASVTTASRASLLRLPREDFDALILSHPQILELISELTDDRKRQNEAVLAGTARLDEVGLMLV